MYSYMRKIFLVDTDAKGFVYFAKFFQMAQEALEAYFASRPQDLFSLLREEGLALPIVHAKGDFKSPITVGDEIEIDLWCMEVGNTSAKFFCEMKKNGHLAAEVEIVHVATDLQTGNAKALPKSLLSHFGKLCIDARIQELDLPGKLEGK